MATFNRRYHRCHLFQHHHHHHHHQKHSLSHPYRFNRVFSTLADCTRRFSLSQTTRVS
ncbi:unnamed protein product, partial [Rotaria magnacalcarata]